jgi:aspartate-semialdehyde dehydrogenase
MVLAPLRRFGLESVLVTTMQAVSGAGYPGVSSMDILGNVVPFIANEEEKMESETCKILGDVGDAGVTPTPSRSARTPTGFRSSMDIRRQSRSV